MLALLQKALGHELPNQLVAIQGMTRLLEAEAGDRLGADGADYLQRLAAAGQRAHETVRTLADFIRALRAPRPAVRTALADAAREAAAEAKVLFPGLVIEYDFPQPAPLLHLPPIVVRQVVGHLLRHVHQANSLTANSRIVLALSETAAAIRLSVSDQGPGLAPAAQERLFEFTGPGTLGLELARQLVESWGGVIQVETQGTTLAVVFPRP